MSLTVLQPGEGAIPGQHLLTSTPDTVRWGWLPNAASRPSMTVASGDTVTIDTLSHEGILADQGRDPVGFLGGHGVKVADVPRDAIDIAASAIPNGPEDGPHVVTGPIAVTGARAGDGDAAAETLTDTIVSNHYFELIVCDGDVGQQYEPRAVRTLAWRAGS